MAISRSLFYAPVHAAILLLLASPALAAKETGYLLTQYSDYWGPQTSYITNKSVLIHSPRMALTMVCRAPDFKVFCFNKKNNSYITCGHREWAQRFVGPAGIQQRQLVANEKAVSRYKSQLQQGTTLKPGTWMTNSISVGGTKEIDGRKASQFFMQGAPSLLHPPYLAPIEFWVIPGLKIDGKVAQALAELGGIPAGIGIPIEIYRHIDKGKTLVQFRTSKIEAVTVDESIFKLPSGFHMAADEMALLTEEKEGVKHGGLADVFGDDIEGLDALTPTSGKVSSGKQAALTTPKGKSP